MARDPYVVACTWHQHIPSSGRCDYAHQEFFTSRPDAAAHYQTHTRQTHPADDWETILIHRPTGETIDSFSTQPYEHIPYEKGKAGLKAFILGEIERHRAQKQNP